MARWLPLAVASAFALASLASLWVLTPPAAAHPGHSHGLDGRLPGQPDLKRIGNRTYRFNESSEEYEVRRPDRPTLYAHVEYADTEEDTSGPVAYTPGAEMQLPTSEDAPVCRSSRRRIVVVYTHRPSDTTPTPTETLRSIVRRMNWKFLNQSMQQSGNARGTEMIVDCSGSTINIHNVTTANNNFSTIDSAVVSQLGFGAVKYLVFDHSEAGNAIGLGTRYKDASKSFSNNNNKQATALIYNYPEAWSSHVPIHELLHTFGASQGDASPKAPFSTPGSHCEDGIDVLCYADGTGGYEDTSCPASQGYNQPTTVPIDCGTNTYFDSIPTAGTWLATYWNSGGEENLFLSGTGDRLLIGETGAAKNILGEEATVEGTALTYSELQTKYQFEYGPTTSYGSTTSSTSVEALEATKKVEQTIKGLEPGVTYHYRLVISNAAGAVYGKDRTFKTSLWQQVGSLPSGVGSLGDISCASGGACTAIPWQSGSVVLRRSGGAWSTQSLAAGGDLQAISCASASACMVVGQQFNGEWLPLAQHWDGTSWTVDTMPLPTDAQYTPPELLADVSCVSANWCVAVGDYLAWAKPPVTCEEEEAEEGCEPSPGSGEVTKTFIAQWDGSEWSQVESPNREGAYINELTAVSCVTSSACTAVGTSRNEEGNSAALALRWNGSTWSIQLAPTMGSAPELLEDVSCGSASACMASARHGGSGSNPMRWNGSTWQQTSGGASFGRLSCSAADFCIAGANLWNGSEWVSEPLLPVGGAVTGISCWSASCVAVQISTLGSESVIQQRRAKPTVSAVTVPSHGISDATLSATVNPETLATTYQFEYGKTTAYGSKIPASPKSIGSGASGVKVSETIKGLETDVTYHFRVVATNKSGTSYSEDATFATTIGATAVTKAASSVTNEGATLTGGVNPNGGATTYYFDYGQTEAYGSKAPASPKAAGSGTTQVQASSAISGLTKGTTYHYRLVATNAAGIAYGKDVALTTMAAPSARIKAATEVEGSKATLRGLVNPWGAATTYQFEYGKTTSFGSKVPISPASVGSGTSNVEVSQKISGLEETTYYYRIAATNESGTTYSAMGTFKAGATPFEFVNAVSGVWGYDEGEFSITSVAADSNGNLYVGNLNGGLIYKYDDQGEYIKRVGKPGYGYGGEGEFVSVTNLTLDSGDNLWVSDQLAGFQKIDPNEKFVTAISGTYYDAVAVDAEGYVYTLDGNIRKHKLISEEGYIYAETVGEWSVGVNAYDIAVSDSGYMYVVGGGGEGVEKYDLEGTLLDQWGPYGGGPGELSYPTGVTLDDEGNVFVSDLGQGIQMFDPSGNYLGQFSPSFGAYAYDVAYAPGGYLWVTDGYATVEKWEVG